LIAISELARLGNAFFARPHELQCGVGRAMEKKKLWDGADLAAGDPHEDARCRRPAVTAIAQRPLRPARPEFEVGGSMEGVGKSGRVSGVSGWPTTTQQQPVLTGWRVC
jgi:hypothetical protein